ncbi:MAG: ATP-binding cassette domain-containing protein [Synergistaceae bacterium]|nr:ATP-binding cassette domain-containing protein [Synergistaceae bacterium]
MKNFAKVPVIMQLEALECGAACLAMILAYYGRWIPLEQLRSDCGVSRDGSNLLNVTKAAQKYNLTTKAFSLDADTLRDKGTFPAIVFWENNHFVVVNGFHKDNVSLNDPARGQVTIKFDEFKNSYSNICLLLKPDEKFEKGGKPASILGFARDKLRGAFRMFMLAVLTTLITSLTGILLPAFDRFFIDNLLTGLHSEWSRGFFILLACVMFAQILSLAVKSVFFLRLQGKMTAGSNTSFLWHVLRLPLEFFEQRMAGDLAERYVYNQGVASALINTFTPLMLDSIVMIFNLFIMLNYSPMLALIGISAVIINLYLAKIISNKRINITRVQMRDMANLDSTALMGIDMIETIKSSGAEGGYFSRWAGFAANVAACLVKFDKLNQTLGQLPALLNMLASNIILFLGIRLIISGQWTIGLISAFNGYLLSFSRPAQLLIGAGQQLQEMRTRMERVQDVFKYPVDVEYNYNLPDTELKKLTGLVEIKNITFGYNKLSDPVIKNFSLRVNAGESVAIVGPSGCGKSTIAKLLTGLYKVWDGQILYDGLEIAQINRNIFTGSVACVNQDITLFEDSIANNIRMWDKSIEDFDIILSARDAQIHDEIINRDGDYSGEVQEGGKNFSGGQRQRLEIAASLAFDPTIIILDEATSALDTRTENELMQAVNARGITRIIISHRLSIIRDCDEIIVMKDGQILDTGTHDELIKRCEYYAALIINE